jgi:hypothetical protein
MYVYVWKDPNGTPFYVGMGKNIQRANPKTKGHRNKICLAKLLEIGTDKVLVELRFAVNDEAAKELESQLIAQYGRLCNSSGSLTNISAGGEFHRTSPATCKKLQALWQVPEHCAKISIARVGKKRSLPESTKNTLRISLKANPAMQGWAERNGIDADFDAKRIAGIKAAQPKRAEKMRDPVALAQRKERLKATLNSPEYKAKRAIWDTPEYRKKLSENKKAYWAKQKLVPQNGQ